MEDNIILNKAESIERYLKRINEEYQPRKATLGKNQTVQDAIVFNLQKACELSIDLAMHIVRIKKLGIPKQSKDAFSLMAENNIITQALSDKLGNMVGFRNIAIHEYQKLSLEIIKSIIEKELHSFTDLTQATIKLI